ncbi:MAG: GIY-YIG nuclease family protein [Verrucomicrobiota bacterium]
MASSTPSSPKPWVLYVLRCADDTLYCGITNDLPKRLKLHHDGKGARYTRGRAPLILLRSWPAVSMSAALKAELAFKKLTRQGKDAKLKSRARKDDVSRLLAGETITKP